jgi:hypothetical protein
MNQKNFEYLRDQVKFTGFGEGLEMDLKEKLQQQRAEFKLYHKASYGTDESVATLYFKKSSQTDMYFFNKYDFLLKQQNRPAISKQTFYIGRENNFTLKEAYNLMCGRAVHKELVNKEGQRYLAWVQIDFKQTDKYGNYKLKYFHQNYGYDLLRELEKHPIRELENEQDKSRLIASLHKGNKQAVAYMENGDAALYFVEANPQFKSLKIYRSNSSHLDGRYPGGSWLANPEEALVKEDVPSKVKESESVQKDAARKPKATKRTRKKKGKRSTKKSAIS